jgi:uncharacterized repeat protein (TIGR01451 family)/MYXO-CTERM domain-containing protein
MNTIVSIVGKALAGGLILALVAAPAAVRAADADLTVTMTGPRNEALGSGDPDTDAITIGQTKTYKVNVHNNGPSTARGVTLAMPTLDPKLTITAVRGCSLAPVAGVIDPTNSAAWPCRIADIQDLTSTQVQFDVHYTSSHTVVPAIPADYPKTLPTVCPATDAAFALTDTSVTVATSTTVDTNLADNTATSTPGVAAIADLTLAITIPAGSFQIGSHAVYTATVTNHGPCPANDVWISDFDGASAFIPPPPYSPAGMSKAGTLKFESSSGDADANTPGCEPIWDGCEFGNMAVGASMTQVAIYTPQAMPADLMQSAYPFNLDAWSGYYPYDYGANAGQTKDPNVDDNVVTVKNLVSQSVSTCSTGGIPGALGLVFLALLPLARRRRQE